MPRVRNNILEAIGKTPLVRLNRIGKGLKATLLAKVEYLNPGGSIKDRIAVTMIDAAEREGLLKPEASSSRRRQAIPCVGLALVAATRGYRCIFVLPGKMSEDKLSLLRAYGAEVVVTLTMSPHSPDNYNMVADRVLHARSPGVSTQPVRQPEQPYLYDEHGPRDMGRHRGRDRRARLRG